MYLNKHTAIYQFGANTAVQHSTFFNSKKERDNFVREYEPCDLNHSVDVTTSNIARKAYTKVFDGVRTFTHNVIIHN